LLVWLQSLPLLVSPAHAYQVSVEPKFFFRNANYGLPYDDSLSQAWADLQAQVNTCSTSGGSTSCISIMNPHPLTTGSSGYQLDGIWYLQQYDQQTCVTNSSSTSCNTVYNTSGITTTYVCPVGFLSGTSTISGTSNQAVWCYKSFPDLQPPPKGCCLGDPIYAATGQNIQTETDYSGTGALSYSRTYRSNLGFSASIANAAFVDYSQPYGSIQKNCYPYYYVNPQTNTQTSYCFTYISINTPQYQLATADGKSLQFSGPSNGMTENADINDRVTQINVDGIAQWQVAREDNTTETYDAAGSLIRRVLQGGATVTYAYSDASTPSSVAPWPGLLIAATDAFGHTLSWQYNSAGRVVQMTDPGGGVYQYSYDTVGNLTGVAYPGGTSKTYWYNESANTGGTNLPRALTGITDENGVRFATFQYNSSGRAVNAQHAGGIDSYTFNYTNPNSTTVVTDPLGTSRTYQFQTILTYDQDTSQTQPAASGSGTVTASETYDANGNLSSKMDFNGGRTCYAYDMTRNLETVRLEGLAPGVSCPTTLATYTPATGTRQRKISTTWNAAYRLPTLIAESNRTTSLSYDSRGNPLTRTVTDTSATPNVSRTWTYTYDSYGRMLTADGPRTDVSDLTTYTYYTCTTGYECGQLQSVTDALGHLTTYNTYNAHGQPLTITDSNGTVTTLTYDTRQRLTSRQVGTEATTLAYWPTGLLAYRPTQAGDPPRRKLSPLYV
jgi:YD repeat-containing protein